MPGCDSRNTALGASSPAKPALHIPDLNMISHEGRSRHPNDERLKNALSAASKIEAVALSGETARGDIPIINDEGCNFFYIDWRELVSRGSCSFEGRLCY